MRTLICLAAGCIFCLSSLAQTFEERKAELRRLRGGVVLVRVGYAPASGVVVEGHPGLVFTTRSALAGAGELEVIRFHATPREKGPDTVERLSLGAPRAIVIHREADVAVLEIDGLDMPGLPLSPSSAPRLNDGAAVTVAGVVWPSPADVAEDIDYRRGSPVGQGRLDVPVTLNSRGGAVLDSEGRLAGIASISSDAPGAVIEWARAEELVSDPAAHAMPSEEAAALLAAGPVPPIWTPSPLPDGPEGKPVDFSSGVKVYRESRSLTVPGVFVLDRNEVIEYLAVPSNGKLHETVIALHAKPSAVNFALLALRYEAGSVDRLGATRIPGGERLALYVEWDAAEALAISEWLNTFERYYMRPSHAGVREKIQEGVIRWEPGVIVRARAEDLMADIRKGLPMERTPWAYTGGTFGRDAQSGRSFYQADFDGVLAAVYRDPAAPINTILEGGSDDASYHVRGGFNPPRGTACRLVIAIDQP